MMMPSVHQFNMITDDIPSEVDTLFLIVFKKKNRDRACCLWLAKHIWKFHTSVLDVQYSSQPSKTLSQLGT